MSDNELDNSKAPLLEHLAELRKRLLVCCVGIIIAFFGFYFVNSGRLSDFFISRLDENTQYRNTSDHPL